MSRRPFSTVLTVWLALVASGFALAWRYETTPGASATVSDWPKGASLALDPKLPTVVSFVHPSCPCTRASLTGIADLARRYEGHARWTFVIVGAKGLDGDLLNSDNARLARSVAAATVTVDLSGAEARRFGARTSGQTFAYQPSGQIAFRGGVTSARGHEGPCAGLDALEAILKGRAPTHPAAPVYGCPLAEDMP